MTTEAPRLRRLGKYELVARIGEGGMAEVHLARMRGPRSFEKMVVVKTVKPGLASRPEIAGMLLEEARIAALVKHPNVVDIYDLGEEDGTFFIAMEYLEGESLSNILRVSRTGPRLDPFSTARIVADCAAGLHAAHELHALSGEPLELVHQDVTPGNVIVLYTGQAKLVDFGVARVRTSVDDGLLKGKTGYLAPELLDGAIADRRSDLWSLGVVLWEALTLRRLFHARDESEAIERIRNAEVPAPSSIVTSVPRDLDDVVWKALERDPARRYQTAAAMQAELMLILRHASWAGGNEPIARFMRSTFVDRIAARRDLLRELALGKPARASTIEQLQAITDEGSPAGVPMVVGAHGTGSRPVPNPLAVAEISDVEVELTVDAERPAPPPPTRSTPAPTVPVPTRRKRIAGFAIVGGALIGAIGAALAIGVGTGGGSRAAPDAGAIAITDDHHGPELAAVAPVAIATDAAPAPTPTPAVEIDAGVEPAPTDHHHHHHHDDAATTTTPTPTPTPTPPPTQATAKSLYKEGLQKFVGGDVAAAIALFDQARGKDGGYAPVYRGLGMAYEKRGDRARAARAFETYLKLSPGADDAAAIRTRLEHLR